MFTTLTSRGLAVTLFIALAILIFNPETDADYDADNIEGVSYSILVNQVRKKSTGTQSWHQVVVDNRSGSSITITWEFAHWIHKLDSESEDITDTPFEDKIWEVQTIPTRKLGSNDHYFREQDWMGKDGWSGIGEGRYKIEAYTSLDILLGGKNVLSEKVEEFSKPFWIE